MQIQNKYNHLHYLICLGGGLRKANADITHDALPKQMQDQLKRLSRAVDATHGCNSKDRNRDHRG